MLWYNNSIKLLCVFLLLLKHKTDACTKLLKFFSVNVNLKMIIIITPIFRCQCGYCQIMDREEECVCCQEIDATTLTCKSLAMEDPAYANHLTPSCITQHPGLMHVCINKWVLKTAWYRYKQQYTDSYKVQNTSNSGI